MDQAMTSGDNAKRLLSDRYATEIRYQKNLRPVLVLTALPSFIFFAVYHFMHGDPWPGTLFSLLTLNAVVTLAWSTQIKDIEKLKRLNIVGLTIAFVLLAFVFILGLLTDDIYIVLPWVFIYPAVILLMMGERIGIFGASVFAAAIVIELFIIDLPPWSAANKFVFKLNIAFALVAMLLHTLVAERFRVKMRNNLLDARNKYKASEARQRLTNEELKSEIAMRVQSEKALSQSEMKYRALFEESSVALWEENQSEIKSYLDNLPQEAVDDLENYLNQHREEIKEYINLTRIMAVNRASLNLYEASSMEELLNNIRSIIPTDIWSWSIERITRLYQDGSYQSQVEPRTLKGHKLCVLVSSKVPAGYEASWEKVFTSIYDITDRVAVEEEKKRVEAQLQHTRQIQAIASLAGGIAHQFNNALTAICGSVELLELKVPVSTDTGPQFNILRGSSERMHRLTEQLLAYARGGKYQPTDFAVAKLIDKLLKSKNEFSNSRVALQTKLKDDVVLTQCDITQIQMVLDAVLTNAVEAVANGGQVVIYARKICFKNAQEPVVSGLTPGNYAEIAIEDTGTGMDEETLRRIFEPFFSTKFVGRGLGMAAAYGIVCNHGGLIGVASKSGVGTRVTIYLPCL